MARPHDARHERAPDRARARARIAASAGADRGLDAQSLWLGARVPDALSLLLALAVLVLLALVVWLARKSIALSSLSGAGIDVRNENERPARALRGAIAAAASETPPESRARLEQMRATVEEKLQTTLEARLSESFRQVSERLEQVHRGLGEMQALAVGVGDLKRVLTSTRARGMFGEMQLATLLEQILLPEQYAKNIATRPDSNERVEFAVKMPGQSGGLFDVAPLWLPIDAKFPIEDYERLLLALERADAPAAEAAATALESRIRLEAKRIRDKYVEVPHTTEFAILFLPTESLYAEVLRRPGLAATVQRDLRIVISGPSTLAAFLNSLQMGFRTLALERRSAEVWHVLGAVKTEFNRFGNVLETLRSQLHTATRTLDKAETRTRQMDRALKDVESLPQEHAARLLPPANDPG